MQRANARPADVVAAAARRDRPQREATNAARRHLGPSRRRFAGLGHQIDEGIAVAIDGEIYQNAYLAPLKPDSEIYLLPKICGG